MGGRSDGEADLTSHEYETTFL